MPLQAVWRHAQSPACLAAADAVPEVCSLLRYVLRCLPPSRASTPCGSPRTNLPPESASQTLVSLCPAAVSRTDAQLSFLPSRRARRAPPRPMTAVLQTRRWTASWRRSRLLWRCAAAAARPSLAAVPLTPFPRLPGAAPRKRAPENAAQPRSGHWRDRGAPRGGCCGGGSPGGEEHHQSV